LGQELQRTREVCSNLGNEMVKCKKKLSEIWKEEEAEKKAE
jgi:hypothetical protein